MDIEKAKKLFPPIVINMRVYPEGCSFSVIVEKTTIALYAISNQQMAYMIALLNVILHNSILLEGSPVYFFEGEKEDKSDKDTKGK